MSTDIPSVPRATKRAGRLAEQLEANLAERIRNGVYQPGSKLPTESEIAAQAGVSRTVVREAITRLQASGLAETRHGIGTFVLGAADPLNFDIDTDTSVTLRDVLEILELRISLEGEAAGLAAARRSDEQLDAMRRVLEAFEADRAAGVDTVRADFNFHLKIAESTGNRYFVDIMSRLGTATIPRNRLTLPPRDPSYLVTIERQHENIYEAIRARDPQAASMMMRLHLTASRERLRRIHDDAEARRAPAPTDGDLLR